MSYELSESDIGSISLHFHKRNFIGFHFRTDNLSVVLCENVGLIVKVWGLIYTGSFYKLRLNIEKILPRYDEETEDFCIEVEHKLKVIRKALFGATENTSCSHQIKENLRKIEFDFSSITPVKSARKI